ncbi:hypothetical protein F4804DRAFT_338391 [Jackrogersella minutella]|nr:hypothetical protein F4804DRAFT_338391 [Jackrogersella minutella]
MSKLPGQRILEQDPSILAVDENGEQLLKHARVYTLAEKFGVEKLRSLASSKIYCVNCTAKGEITYARYIYQYTNAEDTAANFWATRSHILHAEAKETGNPLSVFGVPSVRLRCAYSRTGRKAQARAHRQAESSAGTWTQTSPPQQCMSRSSKCSSWLNIVLTLGGNTSWR